MPLHLSNSLEGLFTNNSKIWMRDLVLFSRSNLREIRWVDKLKETKYRRKIWIWYNKIKLLGNSNRNHRSTFMDLRPALVQIFILCTRWQPQMISSLSLDKEVMVHRCVIRVETLSLLVSHREAKWLLHPKKETSTALNNRMIIKGSYKLK